MPSSPTPLAFIGEDSGSVSSWKITYAPDPHLGRGGIDADLDEMRAEGRELMLLVEAAELDRILGHQLARPDLAVGELRVGGVQREARRLRAVDHPSRRQGSDMTQTGRSTPVYVRRLTRCPSRPTETESIRSSRDLQRAGVVHFGTSRNN